MKGHMTVLVSGMCDGSHCLCLYECSMGICLALYFFFVCSYIFRLYNGKACLITSKIHMSGEQNIIHNFLFVFFSLKQKSWRLPGQCILFVCYLRLKTLMWTYKSFVESGRAIFQHAWRLRLWPQIRIYYFHMVSYWLKRNTETCGGFNPRALTSNICALHKQLKTQAHNYCAPFPPFPYSSSLYHFVRTTSLYMQTPM